MVTGTSRITVRSVGDIGGALTGKLVARRFGANGRGLGPRLLRSKTGLAGELFQKVVNYRGRLAIVIRDPRAYGDRFSELANEHRRHALVRFFDDRAQALQWLEEASVARAHANMSDSPGDASKRRAVPAA